MDSINVGDNGTTIPMPVNMTRWMPVTKDTIHEIKFRKMDWILYGAIVALFAMAVYILVAILWYLSVYGVQEKKKRKQSFGHDVSRDQSSSSSGFPPPCAKANLRAVAFRASMLSICLLCSTLCVVHFSLQQVMIFAYKSPITLQIMLTDKYIYGFVICLGYAFLWIRQRLFYERSSLLCQLQDSLFLKIISTSSLVFVIINAATQLVLVWVWHNLEAGSYNAISWLIGCTLVQGPLLVLFLLPLHKLNKARKRFFSKKANSSREATGSNSIELLVRRCLILVVFLFFTDLMLVAYMVLDEFVLDEDISFVGHLLTDINLLANVISLLGSFRNWKIMLVPWKERQKFSNSDPSVAAA